MDTFLAAVTALKDGDFVRVKMCHLETTQFKVGGGGGAVLVWEGHYKRPEDNRTPTVHPEYIHSTPTVHPQYTHCTPRVHPQYT